MKIRWFSLEEEEAKDGKPNFPKLPPKRDDYPKKNSLAFTDKNSLRSESHVATEREKRIGQKSWLFSWKSYKARMTSHTRNR